MIRRTLSVVLAWTLLVAPARGGGGGAAPGDTVVVQLLAINDFHGNLAPPAGSDGRIGDTPAGGAEYLATHLGRAMADNPNSLVVAAGDLIGAAPLLSALFHNEPTIESMNALHLAVSSIGNHELDKGWRELLRMQDGGCHPTDGCRGERFSGARFQYLAANVTRETNAGATPILPATAVRTIGGVKVGFIGEVLAGTPRMVVPTGVNGLAFLDEASTANAYAAELEKQGVNAIVLLIHQGGDQTRSGGASDPNGCTGFHGDLLPILERLSADVKVVISGHTHQAYSCMIEGRSVTSASSYGRVFTKVQLTINRSTDTIVSVTAKNEVVSRDVEKDAAQSRIIERYRPLAAPLADRVIGSITTELTRAGNRAGESSLGDVVADAHLAATSAADNGGALLAFTNPGGIRTDIVGLRAAADGAPRAVTYGQLFAAQPFANVMTVVTLTGDAIRRLLEQQFDNPDPGSTKFLQVSSGLAYRYALHAAAGSHVDPTRLMLKGKILEPTARVRVTANNFLAEGGDGFTVFREGLEPKGGDVDVDALAAYFQSHSPIAPGRLERIIRTD